VALKRGGKLLVSKPASPALRKSEETMKNSSSTGAKLFSCAFLPLITAVVLVATGARAGLTLINLGSQNES
jgi:hypothetical protein